MSDFWASCMLVENKKVGLRMLGLQQNTEVVTDRMATPILSNHK
jgi:hypothetical protein